MRILYVAQAGISADSGMGRVAHHWRRAFAAGGHTFESLGPENLPRPVHPARFPRLAARAARRRAAPDVVFAHEPVAAAFLGSRHPTIVFSHGLERRGWEIMLRHRRAAGERVRLRSRFLHPLWRLRACDAALHRANGVLVLNREDFDYCLRRYRRSPAHVRLYRNGVEDTPVCEDDQPQGKPVALFVGAWVPRKGVRVLVEAARRLHADGRELRWLLAGTTALPAEVLGQWPAELRSTVEVVPRFEPLAEHALYARATLFVLPSFFEGQPLALLQAMRAGRCALASDNCGQRDLIAHGETGLLHPTGDAGSLATQIAACLDAPELRRRLGAAARRAVSDRTWEAVSRDVVATVEDLAHRGGARVP
jgi:glycosyltransferase involved in cell wall biosynthesis